MHGRYPFFKHRRKPRTEKHWRGSKPRGPVTEAPTYIHMYIQGPGTPSTRPCLGTSQKPIETTLNLRGSPGEARRKTKGEKNPKNKQTDDLGNSKNYVNYFFCLMAGSIFVLSHRALDDRTMRTDTTLDHSQEQMPRRCRVGCNATRTPDHLCIERNRAPDSFRYKAWK